MAYVVRRRDAAKAAEERRRLSDELRAIQSRLAYYETWIVIEAPAVGEKYSAMVRKLRAVAGGAMHDAWNAPAIDSDLGMNIPATLVDLSPSHLTRRHIGWPSQLISHADQERGERPGPASLGSSSPSRWPNPTR